MGHVEMSQAAHARADVIVTRGENQRAGKLIYWSSKRGRAKVMLPSGAVITVATDTVALRNEVNFVADENRDDAKYRNFRSLQPDSGRSTERNTGMPPVRDTADNAQSGLGCETDVTHHVA